MNASRDPVGPLYHGTRRAAATLILEHGFRRSQSRSYTGTGICLSECLSIAYQYGAYETGGCVLEVMLSSTTRWLDGSGRDDLERAASRDAWDKHFVATGLDAVRAYGGNVWAVWQPSVVASLRMLTHREAVRWPGPWLQRHGLGLRQPLVAARRSGSEPESLSSAPDAAGEELVATGRPCKSR